MSERQLPIDAGNTRVKWQLREGTALRGEGALCLEAVSTLPEGPGLLFLSSVLRPLRESELLRSLEALGWTLVALRARGVLPSVVVDAGSALTVDCLTAEGRHEGSWIVPGFALAQRALFQGTDGVRGEWGWCWDTS